MNLSFLLLIPPACEIYIFYPLKGEEKYPLIKAVQTVYMASVRGKEGFFFIIIISKKTVAFFYAIVMKLEDFVNIVFQELIQPILRCYYYRTSRKLKS